MADEDKLKPSSKPASGRNSPVTLKVTPSTDTQDVEDSDAGSATSQGSDTRGKGKRKTLLLSSQLTLKVLSQWSRIEDMEEVHKELPTDAQLTSTFDVEVLLNHIEEQHKLFLSTHAFLEVSWPEHLTNHDYFSKDSLGREARAYRAAKRAVGQVRTALHAARDAAIEAAHKAAQQQAAQQSNQETTHWRGSKLPEIPLPKFSGDYAEWMGFRDVFSSLILKNERLTDVERLHYLKGCLTGEAADHISGFQHMDASFKPAWETLIKRFENRRNLVEAHLKRFVGRSSTAKHTAASLKELLNSVSKATKALDSLDLTPADAYNAIQVYKITSQLDQKTREQWETSLGALQEYPRFLQLETFLDGKVKALERIEAAASESQATSSSSHQRPTQQTTVKHTRTAHYAAAVKKASSPAADVKTASLNTEASASTYGCDQCGESHFIVTCPRFRMLTPKDRLNAIVKKRLCFNCFGRHNARSCRNSRTCRKCAKQHHTMLHDAPPTPAHYQASQDY